MLSCMQHADLYGGVEMSIGFIGLGIMGKPMALNLLSKGHDLIVYDINRDAVDSLRRKARRKEASRILEKTVLSFSRSFPTER